MSEPAPILSLQHATIPPDSERVEGLEDLTLALAPGELAAIVRDAGAETVSLCDIMQGLIEPASGAVRFLG
ncbi:MAG: ABC transporter ATP-binding protein, partial [Deltaproteobacteria bacterium]|nr:ABC transporter ATP-binding protein [Deltaproteobacteria bacterium]